MDVMTAAVVMIMMVAGHLIPGVPDRQFAGVSTRRNAFHRNSRERLNRQAQCQQQDDEEFAPIRHRCRV
jgi:hypothetical protein